jgi:hypothetical protein
LEAAPAHSIQSLALFSLSSLSSQPLSQSEFLEEEATFLAKVNISQKSAQQNLTIFMVWQHAL